MNHTAHTWPPQLPALLQPIHGPSPAGEPLRNTEIYDQIREARRHDDASLPQGIWQHELKRSNWEAVSALGCAALEARSKDLQIAAWVAEAWLHLHGVAGTTQGLELIAGLCEQFWECAYPALDGRGLDRRLSPFRWINEKLSLQLKQVQIASPRDDVTPAHTWLDWESALYWEHSGDGAEPGPAHNTAASLRECIAATPTSLYAALDADLRQAAEATHALERCLRERCGDSAPSLAQFAGVLNAMRDKVRAILLARNYEAPEPGQARERPAAAGQHHQSMGGMLIASRDDAYQKLAELAEYLLRIEPHSPTPFLVRRAVAWGSLSLAELVLELVQSRDDQSAIFTLLGIRKGGD